MRKIIAIVGPTASGKTNIAVKLAKDFNGEIVSADSRQVYRGLDLGTGKDLKDYGDIKYHMIDIVDPGDKMTLFDYLPLARVAIEDIFSRGKLPIIVGGTGLYVQGVVEGFELSQKPDIKSQTRLPDGQESKVKNYSRAELEKLIPEELGKILQEIDPEKYRSVDKKNSHRLIRAIELAQEGLKPIKIKPDFEVLQIGIDIPRKELHEKIDRRVDERFKQGMLDEVIGLINSGVSADWLINLGLEYREITNLVISNSKFLISPPLDGTPPKAVANQFLNPNGQKPIKIKNLELNKNLELIIKDSSEFAVMKQALKWRIHQFARRQMTWFRRFPEINWLSNYDEIKRFAKIFLEH